MSTTTEFAPVTLNGEPVRTLATGTTTYVEVGERLYVAEEVASENCWCRRCSLHEDFGGCIPAEAMWSLVLWMSEPVGSCDPFADYSAGEDHYVR